MKTRILIATVSGLLSVLNPQLSTASAMAVDFKAELFGEPSRIGAFIMTQSVTTG